MDVSRDGTKLGYILKDTVSGNDRIFIYDLKGNAILSKFSIVNSGTGNKTNAFSFVAKDSQVVVSGPTLYDLSGNLIGAVTNPIADIAVSPDQTMIYTETGSYSSTRVDAYRASDLKFMWAAVPPGPFSSGCITSDSKAMVFAGNSTGKWTVSGINAVTGAALAQTVTIPQPYAYINPFIAAAPNVNQVLVGPEYEPSAVMINYNSSTGAGSVIGTFLEGLVDTNTYNQDFVGVSTLVGGVTVQGISEAEYHYNNDKVVIRDAGTGKASTNNLPYGSVVSPNGLYYALASGSGVSVYKVSNQSLIDSTSLSASSLTSIQWASNQRLAVAGQQYANQGPYILGFDGTSLAYYKSFQFGGSFFRISPDGTLLAHVVGGYGQYRTDSVVLTNIDTGLDVASIAEEPNSNGIDDCTFSQNGLLGIHDTFYDMAAASTIEYRVFDITKATPTLVRKITYQANQTPLGTGGSLSPDGQTILLSHTEPSTLTDPRTQSTVRLYRVSDGALLSRWDNIFQPQVAFQADPFTFSPDSVTVVWPSDNAIVAAPVVPFVTTVSVSPNPIIGGLNSTGTITIDQAQPSAITFTLSVSSSSATVPASVTIPTGAKSVTFAIQSTEVSTTQTVAILATYNGSTQSAILTLKPYTVTALSLSPSSVPGGQASVGTVTISPVAGGTGATVSLTSNSSDATVPATVVVLAGSSTATFNINTIPVAVTESLTIKAIIGNTQIPATLTITAPTVSAVSLAPSTVVGGNQSTGTVTLSGVAPSSGIVIGLTSTSVNAVVPASVTVAGGSSTATFTINTTAVTATTLASISANVGTSTQSANLTIQPPAVQGVTLAPSTVVGGSQTTVTGTVTLTGIAPAPGVTIALSSSDSVVASVPATITIATGSKTGTFTVTTTPVTTVDTVTIKAQYQSVSQSATLTVNPFTVTGLALNPTSLTGGSSSTGTVTISQPPASTSVVVNLTISGTDGQLPATVTVPAAATTATFSISTNAVAKDETLTVTAALNQTQKTANLTILAPTLASVSVAPSSVVGGVSSVCTATLIGIAPAGGMTVQLASSNPAATVPASVVISGGSKTAQFTITTSAVTSNTSVTITGTLGTVNQTATLSVQAPGVQTVTVLPTSVTGGSATAVTGTVTLTGAAGPTGVVVNLASANTSAATVPTNVTIPAGATNATFAVTTLPVTSTATVAISGTTNGTTQSANLTVNAYTLASISVSPTSIAGGTTTTGTVTISPAAGTAGATISLASSSTDAQVPATVVVPSGATSATFTVNSNLVNTTENVTLTASIGSAQKTATLTLTGATLSSISLNPTSVAGGTPSVGTVTVSQVAQGSGISVNLTSSSANASLPASVTVPAGSTSVNFNISTTGVRTNTSATITATLGSTSQTAQLAIQAATLQNLLVSPSVMVGGSGSVGTGSVSLKGFAAAAGDIVTLTSSNPQAAQVPATVTITGSSGSASFDVTTLSVSSTQNVTITATFNGNSLTAPVTINPFQVTSLSVSPSTVIGGNSSTGSVTISPAAGVTGAQVMLASTSPNIKLPTTVLIPAGASSTTFVVNTLGVSKTEIDSITASAGTSQKSATLTVTPPTLMEISVSPNAVLGGTNATGTVTVNGIAASSGLVISLASNNLSATVPKTVTIPGGASSASFTVTTHGVSATTLAMISASLPGSQSQSASLSVLAASLNGLSLSTNTVVGGSSTAVVGTVGLSALAPSVGDKITLTSSNPKVASVPAQVIVTSGNSTATFAVTHLVVTSAGSTTISATFNGVTQTAVLSVNPFQIVSMTIAPSTVNGGTAAAGVVTLNAAPGTKSGPLAVKLLSSTKSAVVPASVSVPVGSTSGKFSVTTTAVMTNTTATVTGTYAGASVQANLTILAPTLLSISVSPTTIKGSATTTVTGIVTLTGVAPIGGASINLSSSDSTSATVPVKVTIPAGASSVKFTVGHKKVTSQTAVTLTASFNTVTKSTILTVTP